MNKIKLAVIFGGISTEHDVSIVSGTSVIEELNKNTYEIYPIYINKKANWYKYTKNIQDIKILALGEEIKEIEKIDNIVEYLSKMEVVFPVLHGLGGEDGSIQGLFKMLNIPYVGCGILSSSIGMDKVYTKIIFDKANINQTPYEYIRKYKENYIYIDNQFNEKVLKIEEIIEILDKNLLYPMFIKPSNSGSSVGINKANNKLELQEYIQYASKFDKKILIEQGIFAKEVECAVLGNEEVITSCVGEILPAEEFYSFDAKYKNTESKVVIPADLDKEISNEIRDIAIKAFKAIDGKGLSRVDFFVENKTKKIYINEINTMPGFTKISMYPKLCKQIGISYSKLLDKLIQLAIEEKGENKI